MQRLIKMISMLALVVVTSACLKGEEWVPLFEGFEGEVDFHISSDEQTLIVHSRYPSFYIDSFRLDGKIYGVPYQKNGRREGIDELDNIHYSFEWIDVEYDSESRVMEIHVAQNDSGLERSISFLCLRTTDISNAISIFQE